MSPAEHDAPRDSIDLGPQPKSDGRFAARMRFHQSWYRATQLRVPYGRGPRPTSPTSYGNMLCPEGAAEGKNFLTPGIFQLAQGRAATKDGVVEEYRLLHNMLSSQPMCFNLFGHLHTRPELATPLVSALGYQDVDDVTCVKIEYAPSPKEEYLNDATAFDAYIEYKLADGQRGFIGIETKLSEHFSDKDYPIDDCRHRYSEWTDREGSPWPRESRDKLDDKLHNQLWRNHMLVEAHKVVGEYSCGDLLLVRHEDDGACGKIAKGYGDLCKPDDRSFRELTLEQIVAAWRPIACDPTDGAWLDAFHRRYCDLSASETDWRARSGR
ncbi:MAG TPA: hypothetical protein QGH10_10725 [Armatimonadota bacterium]|nr:hypothetical protein [Armatimonadota bacterium]